MKHTPITRSLPTLLLALAALALLTGCTVITSAGLTSATRPINSDTQITATGSELLKGRHDAFFVFHMIPLHDVNDQPTLIAIDDALAQAAGATPPNTLTDVSVTNRTTCIPPLLTWHRVTVTGRPALIEE